VLAALFNYLRGLFDRRPVLLAIVRRYQDANHNFVGELYRYDTFAGIGAYRLVGCSLDSLAVDLTALSLADEPRTLDLAHDFLEPMPANTLRVGAATPIDNDTVRLMIRDIPRRNIRLVIQNRFIEHVLEARKNG
jgi:hypothetical protein